MRARATQLSELKDKAKSKLEQAGDTIKKLQKETVLCLPCVCFVPL
jgi:hypothetical protein